jgi:hypothetical protein
MFERADTQQLTPAVIAQHVHQHQHQQQQQPHHMLPPPSIAFARADSVVDVPPYVPAPSLFRPFPTARPAPAPLPQPQLTSSGARGSGAGALVAPATRLAPSSFRCVLRASFAQTETATRFRRVDHSVHSVSAIQVSASAPADETSQLHVTSLSHCSPCSFRCLPPSCHPKAAVVSPGLRLLQLPLPLSPGARMQPAGASSALAAAAVGEEAAAIFRGIDYMSNPPMPPLLRPRALLVFKYPLPTAARRTTSRWRRPAAPR